jgi:hypothetical protein
VIERLVLLLPGLGLGVLIGGGPVELADDPDSQRRLRGL